MTDVLDLVAKTFAEFSWRRLAALLGLLLLAVILLAAYETYTSNFRLGRLERATAVLERLNTLSSDTTRQTPEVAALRRQLTAELQQTLASPSRLGSVAQAIGRAPVSHTVVIFLVGGAPFWLLTLVFFLGTRRTDPKDILATLGAALFAVIVGWIATLIPVRASWFNYGVFPLGTFVLVLLFMYLYGRRGKRARDAA